MLITLFRAVLSSALRMAPPLGLVLLLVPVLRKHVRPRTLAAVQKLMMVGMLLALVLALLGPMVRVPISYQLAPPAAQTAQEPPMTFLTTTVLLRPSAAQAAPAPAVSALALSLWEVLGTLWLCGAAVRLALTLTQNARFLRRIRRDSFPATEELSQLELSCGSAIGLNALPRVMIAPAISSPMAAGCLRPIIYLPARILLLPEEEQRLLLTHELHHCKARDNFWRVLSSLLLAVYWFDPLVWALAISFSTQCELCCDENVLSDAPVRTRKLYGGLLLSFATETPAPQPVPSLQSGWRESFRAFKLRIGQIVSLEQKIPGKAFWAGCCLIFVLFSGMVGREVFTPSEVIILSDNPIGFFPRFTFGSDDPLDFSWEESPVPRHIYPIRPPFDTDEVYRDIYTAMDGTPYFDDLLYFFANTEHEPVVAGHDGMVAAVLKEPWIPLGVSNQIMDSMLGKFVIIDLGDGLTVRYVYLDSVLVEVGQWVRAGDVIGTAGNTGSSYGYPDQCGIYVMQDGLRVDPTLFFDVSPQPTKWPVSPGDPGWPDGF